jgi:hypothetical protein
MAFDVFISHSSNDKVAADATCAALEAAAIRCWIAPRDVRAGREYAEEIINAIDACHVMVLIFSASANASTQVRREIERAVSKGVTIVTMRIEDVLPSRSMEFYLDAIHWLDALTPPLTDHLQHLVEQVTANLRVDGASGLEHTEAVDPARHPDGQALAGILINQRHQPDLAAIVGLGLNKVVGPDMIAPFRPEPDAGSVIEPEPASWPLFLGDFEPLSAPDPLYAIAANVPPGLV